MEWKTKFAAALLLLVLGVWIGMSAATGGMEEIHGPLPESDLPGHAAIQGNARAPETHAGTAALAQSTAAGAMDEFADQGQTDGFQAQQDEETSESVPIRSWRPEPRQSFVEKAADRTGVLVQHTAQKSLEALIALFESATD